MGRGATSPRSSAGSASSSARRLAHHGRLVPPARLQHAQRRVVRPPDPARPALFPREVRRRAADRGQPRSLRPHPRPRPDPGQERLRVLSLLPARQPRVPPPRRRIRLGRLRRLRGPGQPGLGALLFGRRQGARAARENGWRTIRRAISSSTSGASATTAAGRRARTSPTSTALRPRAPRPRAHPFDARRLFRGARERGGRRSRAASGTSIPGPSAVTPRCPGSSRATAGSRTSSSRPRRW